MTDIESIMTIFGQCYNLLNNNACYLVVMIRYDYGKVFCLHLNSFRSAQCHGLRQYIFSLLLVAFLYQFFLKFFLKKNRIVTLQVQFSNTTALNVHLTTGTINFI